MANIVTKQQIINDLWAQMFATDFESGPDDWRIPTGTCKFLLQYHGVHFKEAHEIPESYIWAHKDAEAHFFYTVCPGIAPTPTEFEVICNLYMDFETWELIQLAGGTRAIMADLTDTIQKLKANIYEPIPNADKIAA